MKALLLRDHLRAHVSLALHAACWKVPEGLKKKKNLASFVTKL